MTNNEAKRKRLTEMAQRDAEDMRAAAKYAWDKGNEPQARRLEAKANLRIRATQEMLDADEYDWEEWKG